jgi:hypothetical protein
VEKIMPLFTCLDNTGAGTKWEKRAPNYTTISLNISLMPFGYKD